MSTSTTLIFLTFFAVLAIVFASQECQTPLPNCKLPRDCLDLQLTGSTSNGRYAVYPVYESRAIDVYCDFTTDGGGWLVFQRREDGTVNFNRSWTIYENGFGSVYGEHWLGNKYLHALTNYSAYELRIELEDWEGNTAFVKYSIFEIGSSTNDYAITIGGYSGNINDSLSLVSGAKFATYDQDNDVHGSVNCAVTYPSGFWFTKCFSANLNGIYSETGVITTYARGIIWRDWKGYYYSLKRSEMKIRPCIKRSTVFY